MTKIFKAKLEYQSEDDIEENIASSITILFASEFETYEELFGDVMRGFASRHRAVPDLFNRLCAMDVCRQEFSKIAEDGSLENSNSGFYRVWKIDADRLPPGVMLESIGWKAEGMTHLARVIQGVH